MSAAGLDFYDRLVDELLAAGIAAWPALYHWDLPVELMLTGGWLERDTADRFADYAALAAARLGDRVAAWITMEDAALHSFYGHAVGIDAPGITLLGGAFAATHHLLLGHARALAALRSASGAAMGIVNHHTWVRPATDSDDDHRAARMYDAIHNRLFSDPILAGHYPDAELHLPGAQWSLVADGDLVEIAAPVDFYGVSYDHPRWIAAANDNRSVPFTMVEGPALPRTASGWAVEPEALTQVLTDLETRYPRVVLYVAANGAAALEPGARTPGPETVGQPEYLLAHLHAVAAARAAGADVRGWFWSHLLDGWDYSEGLTQRFGLVAVERPSLQRRPRAAYRSLAKIIAAVTAQ